MAAVLTPNFPTGVVEIRSVRVGAVAIKAVHSGFYVAMNRRGRLYGSVSTGQAPAVGAGWRVRTAYPGSRPAPCPAARLLCGLQVPGAH